MDLLGIVLIFAVIVGTTRLKKPLWLALLLASVTTGIFFRIPLGDFATTVGKAAISQSTIQTVLVIYVLTYLQKMMEDRQMLQTAGAAMTRLLNNRRLSMAITPVLIGLLPAPGAVLMAASIIEDSCKDYLSNEEMAFLASFYRHVPESSLPTYTSVILASAISGLPMASFLAAMIPFLLMLIIVPYFIYLRRVPKETNMERSTNRGKEALAVLQALWPIILIIVLILGFQLSTLLSSVIAIVALAVVGRFKAKAELMPMFTRAFNITMLASTFFAMIFKDVLGFTGAVTRLPGLFEALPIPLFLVFALIFFVGSLVGGIQTMVTMMLATALAAYPGVPMMMLLMASGHLAMQLSPTHICLTLAAEYFHTSIGEIFKRTVPVVAVIFVFLVVYYMGLSMVF